MSALDTRVPRIVCRMMSIMKRGFLLQQPKYVFPPFVLLLFQLSCLGGETPIGSDPPPGDDQPGPVLGAPTLYKPDAGEEVGIRPTLIAGDATNAPGAVYTFQVSRNSRFDGLIAASGRVEPRGNGRAQWRVPSALPEGDYHWRVQAHLENREGPFSNSWFTVNPNATPPPPPTEPEVTEEIVDPLTNGTSLGQVSGGKFTPRGWEVTRSEDFIRYELSSLVKGFVEWENLGLKPLNASPDQFMLLGMWDPTEGRYRTNPFRVHLQKLDRRHNPPFVRLRWISNGEESDRGFNFIEWNANTVYRWRLEWGKEGDGHVVRVFLQGQSVIRINYRRAYKTAVLYVELGIQERRESIVGAVYRNVEIGPR